MNWFRFILLALAAYRIQRIVTRDDWPPSEWFRDKVEERFGPRSSWYVLVTCQWCIGTWLTLAVFALDHYHHFPLPFLAALAATTLVGILGNYDPDAQMAVPQAVEALRKMRHHVALGSEDDIHLASAYALIYLAESKATEVGIQFRERHNEGGDTSDFHPPTTSSLGDSAD